MSSPEVSNPQADQSPWHTMSIEETIKKMGLSEDLRKSGLSPDEAASRLTKFGPNVMTEKEKKTLLQRIWHQLNNVLVFVLLVVAAVSLIQAVTTDDSNTRFTAWFQVALILGVITLNTWIGIYQEGNAEKAADALKNMLSTDARVIRGGKEIMIPAREIVPGDVCLLGLGDKIPSDLRLISVSNLATGEAALTGESVPIDKITDAIPVEAGQDPEQVPLGDRKNMGYSATLVSQGSGIGIAIATGDFTQIGTINRLVNNTQAIKTDVLKQIDLVSKYLFICICSMCSATFLVAFFYTDEYYYEPLDSINIALVCAVAMVPEGLEAIVTLTYSYAVKVMASQNAIVRALPAVETLGSVTVICSDKTGTLTQNIMSLTAFVTSNARYKNNVDASDRLPVNFVRDDTYLAERAKHEAKKSGEQILADGPNNPKGRRGHEPSFHFTTDSLHATDQPDQAAADAMAGRPDDGLPVKNGESPTKDWIQSALSCGVLCSKCVLGEGGGRQGEIGNPTELSILRASYFAGIDIEDLKTESPIVAEVPFSSEYKFMATVHEPTANDSAPEDHYICYVKGAPDRMVKLCKYQAKAALAGEENLEEVNENYWIEQIAILSSHGLRVLGLCRAFVDKSSVESGAQLGPEFVNGRPEGKWLTMVGLCAIMDPPRPECVQAIKEAHGAGVRVAMITGDHKDTATAIGHMLGIVDEKFNEAVTGPELDAMSDDEIRKCVLTHNVFARASPQNKIRIVKALQAEGQVTSMTGDGVNDAPALKAANMGVAMGKEGTDVAREASEMILADDNFATIVYAVKQGRVVWDNLRKVLLVNTPINNSQGLSVLVGLLVRLPNTPLTAIQILYSNFICAVTLGFVCAIEPAEMGIMDLPPRRVGKRLIGRYLFLRIVIGTCILTGCVVTSAAIVYNRYDDKSEEDRQKLMRAVAFNVLDFGATSVMMSARFAYNSSVHPRVFQGNPAAVASVAIVAVLQVALTYIPGLNSFVFGMSPMDGFGWGITVLCMVIVFTVMEVEKAIRRNLKAGGADTDDARDPFFTDSPQRTVTNEEMKMPKGASKLNLQELNH